MMIPVIKTAGDKYQFTVDLNKTPDGFEDALEESNWRKQLLLGQAYAEVGHPSVDDHVDPRIALMRLRQIYPERVCAHISVINNNADYLLCELKPQGPHAHLIQYLDSIRKLFVAPRLLFNEDSQVINIITFDVIEVN